MSREAAFCVACIGLLACRLLATQPLGEETEERVAAVVKSSKAEILSLADGANLVIPAGSLSADGEVSLRRVRQETATGGDDEFTIPVGGRYEVDLGGQKLARPVILEIPFDRAGLPPGEGPEHVFLSYFDEDKGEWVFAGGEVDLAKNVVRLEVDHASWWQPATWNWEAWSAALNKILTLNFVSVVEGLAVLIDDCPQEGQQVTVNASRANGLIQGCVEHDDALAPELRIVNPRAIYVEIQPMTGWAYFEPVFLSPGGSLRFQIDTGRPSPFAVSADVTQRAGRRLVIHMLIAMLPGFNELGFQGETLACLTEQLADVSYLLSAVEALQEGKGAAAAEHLVNMYRNEDVMRRLRTGARDCGYGPAATWSVPGLKRVGGSLATTQSSFELISTYFTYLHGEVEFRWIPSLQAILPGRIAYAVLVPDTETAQYRIHMTDAAGDADTVLVEDSFWPDSDLSADGTKLVYVRIGRAGGPEEIRILDLASGSVEHLVPSERTGSGMYPESPFAYGDVRWSGDGRSVYYVRSCFCTDVDSLWRVDVANPSMRERLLDLGTRASPFRGFIEVSPSSDQLLIAGIDPAKGSYEISLVDGRVGGRKPIATSIRPRGCPTPFSPDGESFAFSAWVGDYANIFVKSLDGSAETQVTQGDHLDSCPAWSPDGRWLVFGRHVGPSEPADLWAVSVADGQSIQITSTPDRSEEMPTWGP